MKRILIVEDEAKLARLISRVLGEEGYAAETAGDGRSGLSRALTESFDLLILDWMLPDLLARVRALTRRPWGPGEEGNDTAAQLAAGDVVLDPVRHEVRRARERVELTAKEFALLATLIQRPGQVFTRSVLLDTVWGGSAEVYTNVVDLYVSYLRKKLDRNGEPSRIRTVRGVGYTFEPQAPVPH